MKQLFCIFLSVLLVLGIVCPATATEVLTVSMPCLEAKAGDLLEIPLSISNNSGMISIKVNVSYNASVLSLEKIGAGDFKGVSFSPLTNNPITVNWIDSLHGNNTTNGRLALLTFRVKESSFVGETPLTITANADDVFDNDFGSVPFTLKNGGVMVLGEELPPIPETPSDTVPLGDVNADGSRDAKDALAVLKISVGKFNPTLLQQHLADVNKDTAINAKDALEILKYAVGKPSCLTK